MRTRFQLFSLAALALAAVPLRAQFDSAEVLGTVRDASGAVVATASVTLLNQGTGIHTETLTDAAGNYTFSNVRIGVYTVSAEARGFSKALAKDITVNVNARQRVDIALAVGGVAETVEVTGAAAALDTDSSERGQVVRTVAVVELPLNGRAYSDLALLTNGVVKSPSSSSREGSFNVNGLRSTYNNYLLDGVDNNAYGTSNQGFANQVAQPSPDAVAEFKVVTNNYSAEYGRSGGATIAVAMRSGTNTIHGTLYEFLRNTDLNARGYIFGTSTTPKSAFQQNQFGLTVSGPVLKNRVFYFADYEGFRNLTHALSYSSIPTMNDRQGILPVPVTNPRTGALYPANTPIPRAAISDFAWTVLNSLPTVTGTSRGSNYSVNALNRTYSDKFDAKLDGQIDSNRSAFLRVSQRKQNQYSQPGISGPAGGGGGGFTRALNQQGVAGYTWVVNSTSILEGRFGISRTNAGKTPPYIGGASMLAMYGITGLPTDPQLSGGLVPTSLSGLSSLGRQTTNPQFQNPLSFDWKLNFTKHAGAHALKMGYENMAIRTTVLDVNPLYGSDTYSGAFSKPVGGVSDSASYSIADFMFGLRSNYQLATYRVGHYRQHENFAYIQDDFHVLPKLTLNLGVRYEFATPRWDRDNILSNFDPSTVSMLKASNGSLYSRALVDPDRNNFAPRLGFAYSLMKKTVVRGGYGISYVHQNRVGSADLLGINGPHVVIATVAQSDPLAATFRTTQQGYPDGVTEPSNFNSALANVSYIPKNMPTPYVQSWFVSVQRELPKDLTLDVAYVGNHAVSLPVIADYNQANPQTAANGTASLASRRPIPTFGPITWFDPAAFSNYNGMQVKVERRFAKGLSFLNSFTWSKAIDTAAQALDDSNGNQAGPQDIHNMASEKGVSNYDLTLVNVFSAVWQIPFGRGRQWGSQLPRVADAALGGWQFSAINNSMSGQAVNLRAWNGSVPSAFQTVGNLAEYRGGEAFRPNVTGPVMAANPTVDSYFNTANVSLSTDPSHPFGNAGRNSVRGMPFHQLDLGINKNFQLPREGMRLQFRTEMFNCLNHTNFGTPTADRNSSAFGAIRSTNMARQVQLALKLTF